MNVGIDQEACLKSSTTMARTRRNTPRGRAVSSVLRLVSWNIGLRAEAMCALRQSNVDVALLQEVRLPPDGWEAEHYARGASVVQLSDWVTLVPFRNIPQGRRPAMDESP